MRRVPYTYFKRPDPITGRMRKSRYMLPLDELPEGAEPVGQPLIRELLETEEEKTRAMYGMYGGQR